jgi:hypothetical protein
MLVSANPVTWGGDEAAYAAAIKTGKPALENLPKPANYGA